MKTKFIKENWRELVLALYIFIIPVISFAQNTESGVPADTQGKIIDPLGGKFKSVPDLIHTILVGVLKIGLPIIVLAVIYCGFLFVFARGNPEKLTKAKDALLWTLVGAAILLGSWAIAQMIQVTVTGLGT